MNSVHHEAGKIKSNLLCCEKSPVVPLRAREKARPFGFLVLHLVIRSSKSRSLPGSEFDEGNPKGQPPDSAFTALNAHIAI